MAIPIIYKGDDTDFNGGAPITLNIETAFDLSGCRIELSFLGCRREFSGLSGHTATLSVVFSSAETAAMPVGTHCATLRAYDSAGRVRTLTDSVRVRVTDSVDESAGGSVDVGVGETVEELTPADGLGAVKEVVNKLARLVGASCIAMALCGATSLNDMPGTNTIYTAAETDARILELAPVPDISGKADAANTYTKAETDAKIVELAPQPGNYATVSNKAMSAIQEHQSLWPAVQAATNYTGGALGAFAATGTVFRASSYGTPTRWTDSTGCVWEVAIDSQWSVEYEDPEYGPQYAIRIEPSGLGNGMYWIPMVGESACGVAKGDEGSTVLVWEGDAITDFTATRTSVVTTNLVGRVALTNDIPAVPAETDPTVPSWAKAPSKPTYTASEVGATDGETVTNIVREVSLVGIWDSKLGVWWTPHMDDGGYYWIATTNVDMNAEGNE